MSWGLMVVVLVLFCDTACSLFILTIVVVNACSTFYFFNCILFLSVTELSCWPEQNHPLSFYFLFYITTIFNGIIKFEICFRRLSTGPILDAEKSSVTVTSPGRKPNTHCIVCVLSLPYYYCHQVPVPAALWRPAPASILWGRRSWRCGNRTGSIQQQYYGYRMMAATSSGSMMASRRLWEASVSEESGNRI